MAFSRKSSRRSSRKTRRVRRRTSRSAGLSRRVPRSLGRLGKMSDVYHYKGIINAGILSTPTTGNLKNSTGAMVMSLTDFPIYGTCSSLYEFARVNKCRLEIRPKANMQLNQLITTGPALSTFSLSGRLITAIDQVPFYSPTGTNYSAAETWSLDTSNTTGVSGTTFVEAPFTTNYIRGLQGARETELYQKQSRSFYPACYEYMMAPNGGTVNNLVDNQPPSSTVTGFNNNGSAKRCLKQWVNIATITTGTTPGTGSVGENKGPIYFGPLYALDVNVPSTTTNIPLYDLILHYSISFKRVKGAL